METDYWREEINKKCSMIGILNTELKNLYASNSMEIDQRPISLLSRKVLLLKECSLVLRSKLEAAGLAGSGRTQLVLVAGIPRSGSTWVFNCLRQILSLSNNDYYSSWVDDYDANNRATWHLVKLHDPDIELAARAKWVFTTRRDPASIAGSMRRMKWKTDTKDLLQALDNIVYVQHAFWRAHTSYEVNYRYLYKSQRRIVAKLARKIGVSISRRECYKITKTVKNINIPDSYNKTTQLHPNHKANKIPSISCISDREKTLIAETYQYK